MMNSSSVPRDIGHSSTSTIKSLTIRTVEVAMTTPHRTASGVITDSPLVLMDIMTSEGVCGHSIVFTYTQLALKPIADFARRIEALIVGEMLDPIKLNLKLNKQFRLLGTQGFVGMALAGIDMALWDALARERDTSLTTLLGGKARKIRAYAPIGYDGEIECAKIAESFAKQDFTAIKAKIGYPSVEEDLAVIQAMRNAVGNEVSIMVDYNQSLIPDEAIQRIKFLESNIGTAELEWIEEPTIAHDYEGHANIRKNTRTPIQCGENWWGHLDLEHAIDAESSDYVMLDVMKIGGVTGFMKSAEIAQLKQINISNHLWPELSSRLLSCISESKWLEYCDWWNPILKRPLRIEQGYSAAEDTIGSGIEWDEAAIDRFSI